MLPQCRLLLGAQHRNLNYRPREDTIACLSPLFVGILKPLVRRPLRRSARSAAGFYSTCADRKQLAPKSHMTLVAGPKGTLKVPGPDGRSITS
jgi:hypothetical protein